MLDESPGILKPGKLPNCVCDEPSCKLNTPYSQVQYKCNGQILLKVSHRPGVGSN